MRLKQAKFRGRERTEKQGAEKYVKNSYILHSFYHLTTKTSFWTTVKSTHWSKKTPTNAITEQQKNPEVVQGTRLTILQSLCSAGYMPWPYSLSANPAIT